MAANKFSNLIEKVDDFEEEDWDVGEELPRIKLCLSSLGHEATPPTTRTESITITPTIPATATVPLSISDSQTLSDSPIALRYLNNKEAEDDPFSSDDESNTNILALRTLINGAGNVSAGGNADDDGDDFFDLSEEDTAKKEPKSTNNKSVVTTTTTQPKQPLDLKALQAKWSEESESKKEKSKPPVKIESNLTKWKDRDVENDFDEYFDNVSELKLTKPKEHDRIEIKPTEGSQVTKEDELFSSSSQIQQLATYQTTELNGVTNIAYSFFSLAAKEPSSIAYYVLKSKMSKKKTINLLPTTWSGWNAQVSRIARNLLLVGISSGDRVCLSARVGPLWHSLLLAALAIGAIVVVSPSKANQLSIIQHSQPKLVLLDSIRQMHDFHIQLIDSISHVLVVQSASSSVTPRHGITGKRAYTFVQFMQLNRHLPSEEEALRIESLLFNIKPDQPALIYYQAKASKLQPVVLSHKNLLWTANELNASLKDKIQTTIKTTCSHSLHGLFQFIVDLLMPSVCGGTIHFYGLCQPIQAIKMINPTLLYLDAHMMNEYNILLKRELPSKEQLLSMSPYIAEILKRAFGIHQAHVIGSVDEVDITESAESMLKLLHIPFYPVIGIPETTAITHIAFNGDLSKVNVRNFFSLAIQSKMKSDGSIVILSPNIAIGCHSEDGKVKPTTAEDGWLALPSSVLSYLSRGGRLSKASK